MISVADKNRKALYLLGTLLVLFALVSPSLASAQLRYSLGAMSFYAETYRSSGKHIVRAFPQIGLDYDNLFLNFRNGAGFYLYRTKPWTVITSIGYNRGRKGSEITHLQGSAKNISTGADALVTIAYRFRFVGLRYRYAKQITGADTGWRSQFLVSSGLPLPGKGFLAASISTTYANETQARALYGLEGQYASRINKAEYRPDGGFTTYGLNLSAIVPLTDHWQLLLPVTYRVYTSHISDSPLLLNDNSYSIGLGINYASSPRKR